MALAGIAGKVALVTGAARRRGIGRATALRLAREGADVACLDIARAYAEFPGHGVGSGEELAALVREIHYRRGPQRERRADDGVNDEWEVKR